MKLNDTLQFASHSLNSAHSRSFLMIIAMSIGVAAVVILTALGEGARLYVINQFSSLGTNLVIAFPGRSETAGINPGMLIGQTPRDLVLDDAMAVLRSTAVRRMAPLAIGAALVSNGPLNREVVVLGSTAELLAIRHMTMAQGQFLPEGPADAASPVVVIGTKIKQELFGVENAVGAWLRIGDRRFRVIGILSSQGEAMGMNTDELVIVPVASAHMLFNSQNLIRILVEAKSREQIERARKETEEILFKQHGGERDVTVVTQDAMVATFDRILRTLTMAVGGIAAVSLAVAGVLIMNVMLIAVSQRTQEIGLLKALGAPPAQIRRLFFAEAVLLSLVGSVAGLLLGQLGSFVIGQIYPTLPVAAPWWAIIAAFGTALGSGILFSVWPARRAAQLDPVLALARR
ncbi:MAG: peptide ABC transporter permease [Gallionellales bacterium 35-53-114]|jgi:putative ABC transport system permease protein|nr:MAG: peptide ABC transporter permease [Gallionellales bacterium 35-53-114]OYZ62836.1 MAG: peptide ABC transporter permease [Gallionellales bacterium 24-53-125]OZB09911.1 MAG: peptide ABC transporter permease [Gallionellales bacterium 39-52-133]HQS58420.1 ABC transporter permease [Gallionellaceae bacterium]HQS73975.1 ABC transporter permease [Gallionellaceae bacterium]